MFHRQRRQLNAKSPHVTLAQKAVNTGEVGAFGPEATLVPDATDDRSQLNSCRSGLGAASARGRPERTGSVIVMRFTLVVQT